MVKLSEILCLPEELKIQKEIIFDCDIKNFQEAILYTIYIASRYDYCYDMLKQFNKYSKDMGYDLSILNHYDFLTIKLRGLSSENFSDLYNEGNRRFLNNLADYIAMEKYKDQIFTETFYSFVIGKVTITLFSIDILGDIPYNQLEYFLSNGIPLDGDTVNFIKLYKGF